jgi:hypothetical protein
MHETAQHAEILSLLRGMDTFTRQYLETALWSSHDESDESGGEPMDANYGIDDIHPDTLRQMIADCQRFQEAHWDAIVADLSRAGHDFWLNRNGHGAGFWDGDWPEPDATTLDHASHAFGEYDLYVGDDELIHGCKG